MFGHHDDESAASAATDEDQQGLAEEPVDTDLAATEQADRPSGSPAQSPSAPDPGAGTSSTIAPDPVQATTTAPPAPGADPAWQHPGTPINADNRLGQSSPPTTPSSQPPDKEPAIDVISPAGGFPKRPTFSNRPDEPKSDDSLTELLKPKAASTPAAAPDPDKELMDIRQKALTELRPIVDKLDLPPEEKFRTIMMIIQISDDEALVKAAYDAAHAITDDKDRAQALLDIVNEVNYFTHQPDAEKPEI